MADSEVPLLPKEALGEYEGRPQPSKIRLQTTGVGKLAIAALVGAIASTFLTGKIGPFNLDRTKQEVKLCPSPDAIPIQAPRKNIWRNLDLEEAVTVRQWLMDPKQGLNLTSSQVATESDDFIQLVEAAHPPKEAALAYLNYEEEFDRYAHAIIVHGSRETVLDYLVGPLPISDKTTFRPRMENYHASVPLNGQMPLNWTRLGGYFKDMVAPLEDVVMDLFNGSIAEGTLHFAGVAPFSYDGTWRKTWGQLRRNVPGSWLQPLDMYFHADYSGNDPSKYKIISAVHNGKMYDSIDDLRKAWEDGQLVKSLPGPYDWATREIRGQPRDLDDRAGPRTVQFDGPRYRIDEKEQYVTWMDWAFYVGFERDMGVHLWDINFRGERIIYELSPQEAMAQYSGSDPHQGNSIWLDRTFGMGSLVREVILGYDCPHDGILLNATVHELGTTVRKNAICVFERESGRPLSRHLGQMENESGAVKGYELVARSISSVGNYDYIFDYTFQLDGTIEIRVSASGYLQGGSWSEDEDSYGHRLQQCSMGSLHDHVMNFKVDFDIAGVENSLMTVALEMEDKEEPWFISDWGQSNHQQHLVRRIKSEESVLEWPANMEGAYVIVNQNQTNAWGNHRGYTIHPGPLCHLTNLNYKRTEKNVNWAKHHLAVSRRKDDEPTSSSMWNMNLPGAPPVDFYKFFNNETIVQEDLVVWINLGTHHIPRAEDTPNTLTNIATSYVSLVPWNYFDYDVSIDSRNSVIMNQEGDWVVKEVTKRCDDCLPRAPPALTYHGMEAWDEVGKKVDREAVAAQHEDRGVAMVAKFRADEQEL